MADKVLIVDDESAICDVIEMFLTAEGIGVVKAHTAGDAIAAFQRERIDLVILDVMLPDMSGLEVCKKIRLTSDAPILFLSAISDDDYYVLGYRAGADDYIAKPFKASILTMKIKRMLSTRHASAEAPGAEAPGAEVPGAEVPEAEAPGEERYAGAARTGARTAQVELDHDAFCCRVGDEQIHLTQKEFMILSELIKADGRVLTREKLLSTVWGYDFMGDVRVIDTHIKKLRHKLGEAAENIVTVMSVGYRYENRK